MKIILDLKQFVIVTTGLIAVGGVIANGLDKRKHNRDRGISIRDSMDNRRDRSNQVHNRGIEKEVEEMADRMKIKLKYPMEKGES